MRRVLAYGFSVVVLAVLAPTGAASAAEPADYDADVDGHGTLAVDVAGNAVAVAGDCSYELDFRYRHVNGSWSQQYRLPGDLFTVCTDGEVVAAGRAGLPVAVGATRAGRLAATIRRTDATWSTPYALNQGLPGRAYTPDVTANADGDYAVSWRQDDSFNGPGDTYVAVRLRGSTWKRYPVGPNSYGPTAVGIDSAGNVSIARTVRATATDPARLVTRVKQISGSMQPARQVSVSGEDVGSFEQVIERTGRQTYAYQVAHDNGQPYATSRILRQSTPGGALVPVWSNPASLLPSIAADGGRLRVIWVERPEETGPVAVKTQAFNPGAGTVQTLTDAPEEPVFTGAAIDRYGTGVVAVGKAFGEPRPTTRAYPVTATTLAAGDWIDEANPHWDNIMRSADPVLGAGKQYFIDVDSYFSLPAGELGRLLIYRGQLP